jgi:hypothetical protein
MMDYHSKLLELGSLKVDAAFNGAVKLAGAKSPSEFFRIPTGLIRERFERLSEIIRELSTQTRPTKRQDGDKTGAIFRDLRRSELERVLVTFRETPAMDPATL